MNHEEQLVLYAAGQLAGAARTAFEEHLALCAQCQADLPLWQTVALEIQQQNASALPSPDLADRALAMALQSSGPALLAEAQSSDPGSGEPGAACGRNASPKAVIGRALPSSDDPRLLTLPGSATTSGPPSAARERGLGGEVSVTKTQREPQAAARNFALPRAWHKSIQLLRLQFLLLHRELWLGAAALMTVFLAMALVVARVEVLYFFAPMVAAGTMTLIYGAERDPAAELILATPISPWKILLARLTLVSGFNMVLALVASLVLWMVLPPMALGELIVGWLAPMTFLAGLALLLSLWLGTGNALFIAYSLWTLPYLVGTEVAGAFAFLVPILVPCQQVLREPTWLFALGIGWLGLALWSAGRERVVWRHSTTF